MSSKRPSIQRGEDAAFKIYLTLSNGRPYDLTGVTYVRVRLPKEDIGYVEVDSEPTPATKAYAEISIQVGDDLVAVKFQAVTAGVSGNDISLDFDGSDTLDDVVAAWNLANPSNQVSHDADDGSLVPSAQEVVLSQALDAYTKVVLGAPLQLGEISVLLSEADTELLKVGRALSIDVVLDRGAHPAGRRRIIPLPDAVTVSERFY